MVAQKPSVAPGPRYAPSRPAHPSSQQGSNYVIEIPLFQFLVLRDLAIARNVRFTVPATSTFTDASAGGTIQPDPGMHAIMFQRLHFTGATVTAAAGAQVSYQFNVGGSDIGGFAQDTVPHIVGLVHEGNLRYSINNLSANAITVSVDFLSIRKEVNVSDIFSSLYGIMTGGPGRWATV